MSQRKCIDRFFNPAFKKKEKRGIGSGKGIETAELFKKRFIWFLAMVRKTQKTPWQWAHTTMWLLDKMNGKKGCKAMRGIRGCPTWAKAQTRLAWNTHSHPEPKDDEYGCIKGRRREEATMNIEIVSHKLRINGVPHSKDFYDVSNAFPSVTKNEVAETIPGCEGDIAYETLWQHMIDTTFELKIGEEELWIKPGSGFCQGSAVGPAGFIEAYRKPTTKWKNDNKQAIFDIKSVLNDKKILNPATAKFEDDIAGISAPIVMD